MLVPNGRVIMISGANRGIGSAIAKRLNAAGYRLSLGARDLSSLATLTDEWNTKNFLKAHYEAEDVASHRTWIDKTVNKFGRLDGLINNAGMAARVTVEDADDGTLDRMWEVNVKGPLSMVREALPHLRRSGAGRVVNIASLAGKIVYDAGIGYSMTKFAAVALSHATRHAGWADGVRCTALCPGYVATDMTQAIESFPRKDMTKPEDIAEVVATVLALSNSASIAEVTINCRDEPMV